MRWASRARVAVLVGLGAGPARDARAGGTVDPSYGRVDGDVTLVAGLGATVAQSGPRAEGELRVRYLETVGLFGAYEDGPMVSSPADPRRVLATGLELRPLFLFRWLQGYETKRAWFDLAIDSLGLELGAAWTQPAAASFASQPTMQAGLGLELPLVGAATGPWLGIHGGGRWTEDDLANGRAAGADREWFLSFTLAWHQVVVVHVVDAGDQAP